MVSGTNELPKATTIKGLGKPLQAANVMPGKLYLLSSVGAAAFCAFYLQSWIGAGCVLGATLVDVLAGLISKNILVPPFHLPTTPEEGLHQNRDKICPYWPEETILGPKAMKLEFKDIEIPTTAGCLLRAWLIPPQGSDRQTVLIMSHGAGRDRRAWLRHVPFLAKAGYTCLTLDFRNHGTSDCFGGGGTFLGVAEWEDMTAAAKWVKGNCPGMNAVFMGTSTGAVASMVAVVQDPWLRQYIKCIVAENPFSSPAAVTDFVVSNLGFRMILCKGNQLAYTLLYPLCILVSIAAKWKVRKHVRSAASGAVPSALDAAAQVAVPMLVMHGTNDQIVPHSHSEAIVARYGQGPHAALHESWLCPGAGHCQLWDQDAGGFEARVLAFLSKHAQA